jgi:hypothetical protein
MKDDSLWSALGNFLAGSIVLGSWLLPIFYLGQIILDWLT